MQGLLTEIALIGIPVKTSPDEPGGQDLENLTWVDRAAKLRPELTNL